MLYKTIIEFKTTQINAFKVSCEVIDSLVSDVNFEFSADGFQIKDIDKSSKIFCFAKFLSSNFDTYDFNFKMPIFDIGIDIKSIVNCLKPNLLYDELKFSVMCNKDGLYHVVIRLENYQRKEVKTYNVTTQPSTPNNNTIKELNHSHCITLQSELLSKYCKDINRNSSMIKIVANKESIIFSTVTNNDPSSIDFYYNIKNGGKGITIVTDKDTTVSSTLNIKYFMTFIKCSKLSEEVSLYLSADVYPTIVYSLASLGTLKLVFL